MEDEDKNLLSTDLNMVVLDLLYGLKSLEIQ